MGAIAKSLKTTSLDVDLEKILQYAKITKDNNPIHTDPEFAKTTAMGGIIAHGTMSLALIWQMIRLNFGAARTSGFALDVRFTRPVRIGDCLTAGGEENEDGTYSVWLANQDGVYVIEGKAEG